MKYFQLLECAKYLNNFSFINSIQRVDDNILQINFENKKSVFADLQKSSSTLFMCDTFLISKKYQAPFDIVLSKRFFKSKLESISILKNNRILELKVSQQNKYKLTHSTLLLEFTGRNTNAIILDENQTILEALRHVDISVSYRPVKVGEKLQKLPEITLREQIENIDDIESFLYSAYEDKKNRYLDNLKNQKKTSLDKKILKLNTLLNSLDNKEELEMLVNNFNYKATLLLANKHTLNPYEKNINIKDFDNNHVNIIIDDKVRDIQEAINLFFQKSKKLKKRATSIHIEEQNLKDKLDFLNNLSKMLIHAKNKEEIDILLPKKRTKNSKNSNNDSYATFFIENYKILVGKNKNGNIALLKLAKKDDLWLHVKNIPSSHVIIKSNKLNFPSHIVEFAAKLCVNLSKLNNGDYLVDYTQRKNVKVRDEANVNYINYETIRVYKD